MWQKFIALIKKWFSRKTEPVAEGNKGQKSYKIEDGHTFSIEFRILDMKHLDKPANNDGKDVERFFFSGEGDNIKDMSLFQAMGDGRSGRTYIESTLPNTSMQYYRHKECKAFSDNQPGWHTWLIEGGAGQLTVKLDGKPIPKMKKPMIFHGVLKKIWVGGCGDWRQTPFAWDNLKINGEAV